MRTFHLVLAVLVFLLLQLTVADRIAIGPAAPDFLILIAVFFSLHRGAVQGTIFGFVVGFLQDTFNPEFLGLNALTKSLLGYAVGKVGAKTFPENLPFLFVLFFSAALGHDVIYLVFFTWPDVTSMFLQLLTAALPSAIYTGLLGVLVHKLPTTLRAWVVSRVGKTG